MAVYSLEVGLRMDEISGKEQVWKPSVWDRIADIAWSTVWIVRDAKARWKKRGTGKVDQNND